MSPVGRTWRNKQRCFSNRFTWYELWLLAIVPWVLVTAERDGYISRSPDKSSVSTLYTFRSTNARINPAYCHDFRDVTCRGHFDYHASLESLHRTSDSQEPASMLVPYTATHRNVKKQVLEVFCRFSVAYGQVNRGGDVRDR